MSSDPLLDVTYNKLIKTNDTDTLRSLLKEEDKNLIKSSTATYHFYFENYNSRLDYQYEDFMIRTETFAELEELRDFVYENVNYDFADLFLLMSRFFDDIFDICNEFCINLRFIKCRVNCCYISVNELQDCLTDRLKEIHDHKIKYFERYQHFLRDFNTFYKDVKNKKEVFMSSL